MKTIICNITVIVLLLINSYAKAQIETKPVPDSVRIQYLENAFVNLRNNCRIAQRNHEIGVTIWAAGLIAGGVSFALDNKTRVPVAIGAGVLNLLGFAIILDSHKWIGRISDIPLRGNR